jgi:peptidoglycan/xylan/chitin deacetylase (PgdA/CDA1 family)
MAAQAQSAPSVVLTIDTEPDDQWSRGTTELTFKNTRGLRRFIDFCRTIGAPATYLTSYSVARDPESAAVLREALAGGDEIGGHLHAWETPPLTPADASAHPYIFEYDPDVRLAKLAAMTKAVEDAFGVQPVSYRAGRWGFDDVEADNLASLGYRYDTSVVSGHDFRASRGHTRPGPSYRHHLVGTPAQPYRLRNLLEAPVSVTTLGSIGGGGLGATLARTFANRADRGSRAIIKGLRQSGLCRMVWVRPLKHPRADLVAAALQLVKQGARVINIMTHSSECFPGTAPHTRNEDDLKRLHDDIAAVVAAVRSAGVTPRTLKDALATS